MSGEIVLADGEIALSGSCGREDSRFVKQICSPIVAAITMPRSGIIVLNIANYLHERRVAVHRKKILYNRERLYSIGIILYKKLFLFSKKLIEFVHKGVNILELAINRRKTYI